MLKVTNLKETDNITPLMLRAYIAKKITALMTEYNVDTLDNIGCFVVLEKEEITGFDVSDMEFIEVLEIGGKHYLHGVKILGDSYGNEPCNTPCSAVCSFFKRQSKNRVDRCSVEGDVPVL